MAEIAKSGSPSICTPVPCGAHSLSGDLFAGETINPGDACYIKNDGSVWRCNGAAATAPARYRGVAATRYTVGKPVTLHHGVNYNYGAALTPGADYYLSSTVPGGLADVATTGGSTPIATAVDAYRVHFFDLR